MRDVTLPSFALNPDYLTAVVQLTDGRALSGVVRTVEGKLHIGDQNGTTTVVDPARVESLQPSPVSTMPEGQLINLGPERTRDLMTFLLTPPPSMPRDYAGPRPARPAAEVGCAGRAPSPP
jgi:putative heme-binding domain-containing protein